MNKYWIAGLFVGSVVAGFVSGCQYRASKAEKEQAQAEAQYNAELLQKTKQLQMTVDELNIKYSKENQEHEKTIANLRSRINDGSLRMSVGVKTCVSNDAVNGSGKGRAELDSETAQELLDIASTGDRWGRSLNKCIDKYNAVRSQMK